MGWVDSYVFEEPLVDVRQDRERADALTAELGREVEPGHLLHGRSWRVIARALPNDDVVVQAGGDVAIVHLAWSRGRERAPYPRTTFLPSADELSSYLTDVFDRET